MKRLLLILCLLFSAQVGWAAPEGEPTIPQELYQKLDAFARALNFIDTEYVKEVDHEELIYGAIEGMLSRLDPHSTFMAPEDYETMRADTKGSFGGVGLEVSMKEKTLIVVAPLEGTPGQKAGVQAGDRIIAIDGYATRGMSLTEAVGKMRGKSGSQVQLTLTREGVKEPFVVTIVRDTIRIKSVKGELLESGYAYLRIVSFQEKTSREMERLLKKLISKNGGPLRGLILDLRNNPGGLLDEAVAVADAFLKEGTIVSTVSRKEQVDLQVAHEEGTFPEMPMIVLVNGGSASAAEIVAGALQDHERAVLLGTQTFGKGSVQTLFTLDDGSAIKLTVAFYHTPSGRSIQAEGIQPDILVEATEETSSHVGRRFIREKDLRRHLEKDKAQDKSEDKEDGEFEEVVVKDGDYQKAVALDYLKSWDVFRKRL